MFRKYISMILLTLLITTGLNWITISDAQADVNVKTFTVSFSEPLIITQEGSVTIYLEEATSIMNNPYYFQLPVVTTQYTFPFKTQISSVSVEFSSSYEIEIGETLRYGAMPLQDGLMNTPRLFPLEDEKTIYEYYNTYTMQQYAYHVAAGRQGKDILNILSLSLYPIQYDHSEKKLICFSQATITIAYEYPQEPLSLPSEYELLVIGPNAFVDEITPLVEHKIATNMSTKLVTVEDVFNGVYFTPIGRDDAEILKYFIKDALDEWGITYVLLIGGRKGGVFKETWWVPVRYSQLDDGNVGRFISDLYFADIYDAQGNFSSWDSNDNDRFSEWTTDYKDIPDMYPDVFVGRLACRSKREVSKVVNKIIAYETQAYNQEWFTRYIGISGDTYPAPDDPYFEGELATEAAAAYLEGFEKTFLWTSTGTFTGPQDIIREISNGAGFAHFSGHGNPFSWSNHPPNDKEEWVNGLTNNDMWLLRNDVKLPVVIVGGCSNGQFNVSVTNMIKDILRFGIKGYFFEPPYYFYHRKAVPHCWSWSMVNKAGGGAIAVISNTCLGYGLRGENWSTGRGRWMEMAFFRSYTDGNILLGQTHGQNMAYYLNEFYTTGDVIDHKMVQQWALLGDPSLRIGGIPQ